VARRKADILLLGLLALAMSIIAILALLYYASKTAQPPPQQPPRPPPQQPKPPTITATIEATQGGRVLANGRETTTWSSTKPFTLVLEALPEKCHAFDHWLVNGTRHPGESLTLTIAGNTTIKAVFQRLRYKLSAASNASWGLLAVNGSIVKLPFEAELPCGAAVRLALLPGSSETHSFTPVGLIVNDSPVPGTEAELRAQGDLSVVALYRAETHVLLIESNAPGVKVLVDGAEVTLPARVQRPRPFTALIQAPPLIKVNETLTWGSPEVQELGYRMGMPTWFTLAAGNASVRVEGEKRVRVYYYPYYSLGKDTYVTPLYGNAYVEGNTIIAVPDQYYVYVTNIILPPNWTRVRIRVESNTALSAVIMFPYNKNGNIYDVVYASVDAQRGPCTKLTAEFEVVRNPPSARVLSYHCDVEIAPNQYYTWGPWNYGKGNEQYLGRLIVVDGVAKDARIYVEVEG